MANIYLRVPHYVGSYFRNKEQLKPIPVGGVVVLEKTDILWTILSSMIHFNNIDNIVRQGCFCERQWKMMKRGMSIVSGAKKIRILVPEDDVTLSDEEVVKMSGLNRLKGGDDVEYLCLRLPQEVYINGVLRKTNDQWQLLNTGSIRMLERMKDEFWRAFFVYTDRYKDWCVSHNIEFNILEGIERFMTRYDICNSIDEHEKKALKRNYYRKRKAYKFTFDDFVEFATEKELATGL